MSSPMDWREYLNEEDVDVPLHALRYTCTERISMYLNKQVQLRPGMRHTPNFGGLGELIGLDGIEISEMRRRENPGLATLDLWKEKRDLKPTVGNLVKYLATLGRRDILTDTADWINDEIAAHKSRQQNIEIQCETVSSAMTVEETNRILTIDDVVEGMTIYDAFICFDTADIDFVRAMIAKLENRSEFGFRFFVPGRNDLLGTNSNALTTKIISERCRHMIVVLSNSFLKSPACEFQTAYAFSLNPGARDKKLVPIKIEECKIPGILHIMACCDFTNTNLLDWCWKRLAMSIMCPMPNSDFLGPQSFVPPPESALAAWARLGFAETGEASPNMPRKSCDSGFSSGSLAGRGPVTVPISSLNVQPSTTPSRPSHNHTAPVSMPPPHQSSTSTRDKSPGPVSQAFKRITQTLGSSKIQKKKHKTTTVAEPQEPAPAI